MEAMKRKPRKKMPVLQRAKQFAPFQSLGELASALKRAEEEHRMELENSGLVHTALEEASDEEEKESLLRWKVQD